MGPIYALILTVLFRLESATLHKVLGMTDSLLGDFIAFVGSLGFAFYLASASPLATTLSS
jgi:hypothetical protein